MKKTVGQTIREARIKGMTQKELAAKIMRKEEGREEEKPITPQYLNDIEHDRRTPPVPSQADREDTEPRCGYSCILGWFRTRASPASRGDNGAKRERSSAAF